MELDFEAIAKVDDETAYASSYSFNGLFKVNFQTGSCEYITMFPEENPNGKRIHTSAVYAKDNIYFIPASGCNISIYRLKEHRIETMHLEKISPQQYPFYNPKFKFADAFIYDGELWMVPSTYPGILKMDLQTETIQKITAWIPEEGYFFRKGLWKEENVFYIPSANNNLVLEFDLRNNQGKLHHVGKDNKGCWSICRYGKNFWLAPKEPGAVIAWEPKGNQITEYHDYPEKFDPKGFAFTKIYVEGETIWLIPAFSNMFVCVKNGKMLSRFQNEMEEISSVAFMFEMEGTYYLLFNSSHGKIRRRLSRGKNQLEEYFFRFERGKEEYRKDYFNTLTETKNKVFEGAFFQLEDFLFEISQENSIISKKSGQDTGTEIYKVLI